MFDLNHHLLSDPATLLLTVHTRGVKTGIYIITCMQTFRAALFIISANWKQPSHLTDKRRSKLCSLQMMTQPSGSGTRLLVLGRQGGLKCTVQKGRGQTHRLHSVVVHACSVVSDFCDLMDCSWPGFSVHGIFFFFFFSWNFPWTGLGCHFLL